MKIINRTNLIIILIVIVATYLFYWYEWRPARLVKACHLWSLDRVKSVDGDREDVNYFYKKCLRENGIDK
jgi:hypothetical protein